VLCPACQKLRDYAPNGVLRLTGDFVALHRDEILNLIRNQTRKADSVNPLERVMSVEAQSNGIELTTTNEKLAQRIGRAIFKAYSGRVEYQWSPDNKLARVYWHRDF
jgi:NMD protein affecting ribosome stability and mRNA decay